MGINTTITCDGCSATITPINGYLIASFDARKQFSKFIPSSLIFCDATCISKYVAPTTPGA